MAVTQKAPSKSSTWLPIAALALGLSVFFAGYRLRLGWLLYADPEMQAPYPLGVAMAGGWQDAAVIAGFAVLMLVVAWPLRRWLPWPWLRLLLGGLGLLPLLVALGSNCQTHLRSIRALHCGLNWGLLQETFDSGELSAVLTQAGWVDVAATLAPVLLVALAWQVLRGRNSRWLAMSLTLPLLWAGASLGLSHPCPADQPAELSDSPLAYTVGDMAMHLPEIAKKLRHGGQQPRRTASAVQHASGNGDANLAAAATAEVDDGGDEDEVAVAAPDGLRMVELPYAATATMAKQLPAAKAKTWNIVWVIMESTGRRYLQGDTPKGLQPMPFLAENLAKRGWWLAKHRSPSNSSATSIFAQMSGLYPSPSTRMFSVQKENYVPTLFNYLGDKYERFLVTPGKLSFFFPRAFLQHGGLGELHGYDELKNLKTVQSENFVRNEIETMSYFLERLRKAKPPFAAVYYSFSPHWEYVDYGPQYHRFTGARPLDRYLNALYLLDTQLQRLVEQLEKDGVLDSTIVVLAGDHGEAFGQHDKNWAHSRASFEENFGTPGLLLQSQLFPPKVIERDTLHIDLLPTVLDAVGVAYDDALVQGESLFQSELRRKVQFFWGNENTLSGIFDGHLKVQWAVGDNRCWAFELQTDPREKTKLSCADHASELEVLKKYRDRQRAAISAYSAAVREGQLYGSHRPPATAAAAKHAQEAAN